MRVFHISRLKSRGQDGECIGGCESSAQKAVLGVPFGRRHGRRLSCTNPRTSFSSPTGAIILVAGIQRPRGRKNRQNMPSVLSTIELCGNCYVGVRYTLDPLLSVPVKAEDLPDADISATPPAVVNRDPGRRDSPSL